MRSIELTLLLLLPMLLLAEAPAGHGISLNDAQPPEQKGQPLDAQDDAAAKSAPKFTLSELCKQMLAQAQNENAGLDSDAMIRFYAKNSPDLLSGWETRSSASREKGVEYLKLLIKNFLEIDKFRESNPDEYERLARHMQSESLIRITSLEIQNIAKNPDEKEKLQELKLKLRKLMEDAFDEAQRRQLLEINRLENEVRNLKNLAEQRAANKQSILQQRFILLTNGQEWPK